MCSELAPDLGPGRGNPADYTIKAAALGTVAALRASINRWADYYEVPRSLVHRLATRESTHNPTARNGPYYGLLQILPQTAQTMGFKGQPAELLNADTNLEYAVKYLRGAWLLSDGDHATAIGWYARGYYFEAKRRGMLVETGLRSS